MASLASFCPRAVVWRTLLHSLGQIQYAKYPSASSVLSTPFAVISKVCAKSSVPSSIFALIGKVIPKRKAHQNVSLVENSESFRMLQNSEYFQFLG